MFGLRSSPREQVSLNRIEISTDVERKSPGPKTSICKCGNDHTVNPLVGAAGSCGPTPPSSDDLKESRKKCGRGRPRDSSATRLRKEEERKQAREEKQAKKAEEQLARKTLAAKSKPKKKPSAADRKRQQPPQRLRKLLPGPERSGSSSSDTLNSSGDPLGYIARGIKRVKIGPFFRQGERPRAPIPQFDPAAEMLIPQPGPTPGMFNISTAVPGAPVAPMDPHGQVICNPTHFHALPLPPPGPTIYAPPPPAHRRIRSNSETTEVEIRGIVPVFQGELSRERQNTPQLVEFFSQQQHPSSSLVQAAAEEAEKEKEEEAPPSTFFQDAYFPIDPAIYNDDDNNHHQKPGEHMDGF